ncbi:MAG: hypothetical protein IKF65_00130, partial [Clostridia bacterium]|nr:hypothetical protein [Clostridia bacterium]
VDLYSTGCLPLRTNWLMVGIQMFPPNTISNNLSINPSATQFRGYCPVLRPRIVAKTGDRQCFFTSTAK